MVHSSFVSGKKFFDSVNFPRGFQRSGFFSVKEADALLNGGVVMQQLADGKIQPQDEVQEEFLRVVHGEKPAETIEEKAWMKYWNVILHPRRIVNLVDPITSTAQDAGVDDFDG